MQTLLTQTRHGQFLLLRGDMISQYVQMYGEWCEAEVELYQALLTADSQVVEVGCNIGLHTVPLAKMVHQGSVFAFEPQRIIYQMACANVMLNNLANVFLFNNAVGECQKTLMIETCDYHHSWNYGSFSVEQGFSREAAFPAATRREPCQVVALDEIINTPVRLLKIDAEGYELKVLAGAENLIKSSAPFIFIENNTEDQCQRLIDYFQDRGYRCYWFISPRYRKNNFFQHYLAPENRVDVNMLCVPAGQSVRLKWSLSPATHFASLQQALICQ